MRHNRRMSVTQEQTDACRRWIGSFTQLETPRLVARPLVMADDTALFEALQNPRVHNWVGPLEKPFTLSSARRWLTSRIERMEREEGINCGVFYRESGTLMGFVGAALKPELGGMTIGGAGSEVYWGKGFAEEIGFALVIDLFSAGVAPLMATTALDNYASERLLRAFNFEEVGEIVSETPGGARASRLFMLTEPAFRKAIITPDKNATSPDDVRARRKALLRQCQEIKARRKAQD